MAGIPSRQSLSPTDDREGTVIRKCGMDPYHEIEKAVRMALDCGVNAISIVRTVDEALDNQLHADMLPYSRKRAEEKRRNAQG